MLQILAKDYYSYAIIKRWEFKWSRDNIEDDPRPGLPKTSTMDEQIDTIHSVVLDNRCGLPSWELSS